MTRRSRVLVATTICCLLAVADEAAATTGNEFRGLSESERAMYVVGTLDGWSNVTSVIREAKLTAPVVDSMYGDISRCLVERRMTRWQTFAIVEKYVRDNPAKWHEMMAGLIWAAMREACQRPT